MKLMLCCALLMCCSHLVAQKSPDASFKRFGVMAGINVANMNFNKGFPPPPAAIDPAWKSGLTVGLLVRVQLFKNAMLQPEYSYTQRRGADRSTGIRYRADYLSMPVLLKYTITRRFALVAGPQFELMIQADQYNHGVSTSITHDMEERSIGGTAGFDVQLYKTYLLSARYMHGLNHVGIGQRSDVKEFNYEVVTVTAGVRF